MSIVHSFLSSYLMHPAPSHIKAALYILHCIHSTYDFGIFFSSRSQEPIHMYLRQPAFTNDVPPKKGREHHLITYSDACMCSQIGNAIPHGISIPLFKFRSISGAILYCKGGSYHMESHLPRTELSQFLCSRNPRNQKSWQNHYCSSRSL